MANPVYLNFHFPDTRDIDVLIQTLQDVKNSGYNTVYQGCSDTDGQILSLPNLEFTAEK